MCYVLILLVPVLVSFKMLCILSYLWYTSLYYTYKDLTILIIVYPALYHLDMKVHPMCDQYSVDSTNLKR